MTTPNILQGQIAIDPNNGILFYKNNSNTLVNTTLHWSQYDSTTTSTSDDIRLEANITIDGNLIVNGSQTAVESTTVYVKDPVFTLGGNTNPTSDDNKDRGIEFRWHNGSTAKLGFFGFDDSTGKFTFIPDATNTSEVYSGTSGELSAKVDWSNIINKDTFVNSLTGTANEIEVSSNTGNVTLSLPSTINANTTGTAAALTNARTISLSGDVTGSVSFDGSGNVDIPTTIAINSLVLGTDTTGDYVQSLVAGTGITLANNSGESATPTVSVTTNTFDAYGAAATAATNAATALTNHEADTTNIHGIADTSILVTTTGTQTLTNKIITSPVGIVKGDVGLGNVDNTADTAKPVSTAQQTAIDLKANIASPTFTGNVNTSILFVDSIEVDTTGATSGQVLKFNGTKFAPAADNVATAGSLDITDLADVLVSNVSNGEILKWSNSSSKWVNSADNAGTAINTLDDITDVTITSATAGDLLKWSGSVWINDSTSLAAKAPLASPTFTGTVSGITKTMVGLENVDNTADTAKPVSTAQQTALDLKANIASPTFTGTVTVPDNSFALGTKTTGDYVATITGGTGVSSTASTSGEGTTHTLSIGQAVGTADNVTFAGLTADAITIGITSAGEIDTTSGNLTIDSTGGTVTVDDNLIVTGNATINNDLIVTGNITINGNTTTLNTETITVEDKTIELGSSASPSNTTANGAGIIVPDGAANKSFTWSSSSLAWSSSEDLNLVSGKVLKINGTEVLSATNYTGQAATVAANSVTATTLQEGVPRAGFRSQLNAQTGTSYTLQLTDLAKLVTMDNGSTMTLTVPLNSSVSFQIGDRIDILRKGSGELTIGYAGGVVINGTPGLKLRAQWSSATLVKLDTDTWVALGDLKI